MTVERAAPLAPEVSSADASTANVPSAERSSAEPAASAPSKSQEGLATDVRAAVLDLIAAASQPKVDLDGALQIVLTRLGAALGSRLARLHRPASGSDTWQGDLGTHIDLLRERLLDRLDVVDCAQIETREDIADSSLSEALLSLGIHGVITVPAVAEGRLVAAVQLFTDGRLADSAELLQLLEILSAQLGHVATRERMRQAVKHAAKHTRATAAGLEALRLHSRLYDPLTGLPSKSILRDRIRQAIRRRQRSSRSRFAVLLVEVGGLARVREKEGEEAAQEVLLSAARRVSGLVRPADTVAHDGDRLVLLVEGIKILEEAKEVAARTRQAILRPFPLGSSEVRLAPAIAIVFAGPAYETAEALLSDAEVAVRRARESAQRVQVFDKVAAGDEERQRQVEDELAGAIHRKDFFLEYQPIVSLQDGRITGLEVFIRWRHPEMGLVPPDVFIPLAVASPLVHQLGYWIIDQTCEQVRRWQANLAPRTPPPVAINIAGRQLFHQDFSDRLLEILERNGVVGEQIRFDISETDLMGDPAHVAGVLDRIRELGIRVAVDDFGTGFSSLSLLHSLPVNALKIDRSFVSQPRRQLRKGGVERTIVELAKILDLEVIAEGIETRDQFVHLRKAGCTQAQGFYFSGPVGAAKAERLIRDGYPLDAQATAS